MYLFMLLLIITHGNIGFLVLNSGLRISLEVTNLKNTTISTGHVDLLFRYKGGATKDPVMSGNRFGYYLTTISDGWQRVSSSVKQFFKPGEKSLSEAVAQKSAIVNPTSQAHINEDLNKAEWVAIQIKSIFN